MAFSNKKGNIRVLHVDDDRCILEITKLMLLNMCNCFDIDNACCVDDALEKLASGQYDVVVSDYEMPQKNGIQFLMELRKHDYKVAFILFTGKGREEVAIQALNLGADGYYNKQGSPETVYGELCHGIRMALARRFAEAALIETQTLTNSIINSTQDLIWSVSADDDFHVLTFNKALSDYFLRTQNLILKTGMSTREIMPTEHLALTWHKLNKRALKEGSFTLEYKTLKDPRILELTFSLLKRGEEVFGIAVFGKDITEHKKAVELLKKSEARYRELVENLPAPIFEVDGQGKVVFANSEAFKMTGYSLEDFKKGFSVFNLVPEREWETTKRNIRKSLAGLVSGGSEYTFIRKDGTEFPVVVNAIPVVQDDGSTILRGVVTDISKRKKTEKAPVRQLK